MNKEEILKAIEAILDGGQIRVTALDGVQYVFLQNPYHHPEIYGESPAVTIDFRVLKKLLEEA